MRREEADGENRAKIDRQAREMFAFFKSYSDYVPVTEDMERVWDEGTIMKIYQ